MASPRIVVVGAGPAGVRAAERLVVSGFRPVVIDEGASAGGQIYRRQPGNFSRSYVDIYGRDAARARALHESFDRIIPAIEYHAETTVWGIQDNSLYTVSNGLNEIIEFDAAILATGATDRLAPVKGWTLPGCYSLGGSQIALKAQACAIGRKVVFLGTGPLLYLVGYQYAKAGVQVQAVLDMAPIAASLRALTDLLARPNLLARGVHMRTWLMAQGIPIHNGIVAPEILGTDRVVGVRYQLPRGARVHIDADAVGMGFNLRSETQLADLAGCDFVFDAQAGQWRPYCDETGRTHRQGVYVAGDGARVLGAHAAEVGGHLAALTLLQDLGLPTSEGEVEDLRRRMRGYARFQSGLLEAFPWPERYLRSVADDVLVCRCESITAGELRAAALELGASEINRAKALCRIGMGRCQGRFCGSAAAEVLAECRKLPIESIGRIRGQAPIKPLPVAIDADGSV